MTKQEILNTIREKAELEDVEIIGLPVQLNDLLLAISVSNGRQPFYGVGGVAKGGKLIIQNIENTCYYDLTQSVEWNLENNHELRQLISNLIK